MEDHSNALVIAIVGAVAALIGGALSAIYQHLRDYFSRPILVIDFEKDKAPHMVHATWKEGDKDIARVIARASVRNTGKRVATNCRIFLFKLQEVQTSKVNDTNFADSVQLPWAGWDFNARVVPRGVTFFIDLVRVRKDTPGWDFPFQNPLQIHKQLKDYRGTYRFCLVATADNADPSYCIIDADYQGDWNNFRVWKFSS